LQSQVGCFTSRSKGIRVRYANELLQCDCHEPNIAASHWLHLLQCYRYGSRQLASDVITTAKKNGRHRGRQRRSRLVRRNLSSPTIHGEAESRSLCDAFAISLNHLFANSAVMCTSWPGSCSVVKLKCIIPIPITTAKMQTLSLGFAAALGSLPRQVTSRSVQSRSLQLRDRKRIQAR